MEYDQVNGDRGISVGQYILIRSEGSNEDRLKNDLVVLRIQSAVLKLR